VLLDVIHYRLDIIIHFNNNNNNNNIFLCINIKKCVINVLCYVQINLYLYYIKHAWKFSYFKSKNILVK